MQALTNCTIHTASGRLEAHAVLIEGRHIADIVEVEYVPADIPRQDLEGGHLAPGFIDVQVNGGGGVMFNTTPTAETIATMASAHRRFGTVGFLPTLITDARARAERLGVRGVPTLRAGDQTLEGLQSHGTVLAFLQQAAVR